MKKKTGFFAKISKTDKPLANLSKRKRKKTHINRIRNEKENHKYQRNLEDLLEIFQKVSNKLEYL
jgi:hypothetical protein